jgi:hypothetical protein
MSVKELVLANLGVEYSGLTVGELVDRIDAPRSTVSARLCELVKCGHVVPFSMAPISGGRWSKVYVTKGIADVREAQAARDKIERDRQASATASQIWSTIQPTRPTTRQRIRQAFAALLRIPTG